MSDPTDSPTDRASLGQPRIRTFHARHGRITDRMRKVLAEAGPRFGFDARRDPDRPVVFEVGCGFGEAAHAFAEAHPDVDVLAVDVHTPGIVATLEAAESVTNLYVELADAVDMLDARFQTDSLERLHVFFPDPWPKARHNKRRFIRPDILDLCAQRLRRGGVLAFATDVADYAEWARGHLDDHSEFRGGEIERPDWRAVTRYETQALEAGRRIVDLEYERT